MPRLRNVRHERFALLIAMGRPRPDAYAEAGFVRNRRNALALHRRHDVQQRVDELLDQQRRRDEKAVERSMEKAAISKYWVLEKLRDNAERCMRSVPVRDEDGNKIGEYKYDASAANRALELIGRELGMFVNRGELKVQHDYAGMTDEQRMRWAYQVLEQARAVLDVPDESEPPLIESEPQGA